MCDFEYDITLFKHTGIGVDAIHMDSTVVKKWKVIEKTTMTEGRVTFSQIKHIGCMDFLKFKIDTYDFKFNMAMSFRLDIGEYIRIFSKKSDFFSEDLINEEILICCIQILDENGKIKCEIVG